MSTSEKPTNGNGYVTLSTLVTALLAVMVSLASIGGTILTISFERLSDRLDAHEKRLDKDDSSIVPDEVHKQHWAAQAALDERQSNDIKDLQSLYTIRDAFGHLQTQVDCLQFGQCKPQIPRGK